MVDEDELMRSAPQPGQADDQRADARAVECGEAEFVVCCFALCDYGGYSFAGGRLCIRGEA